MSQVRLAQGFVLSGCFSTHAGSEFQTGRPERYGTEGNAFRYEPLQRAQELEHAARAAWRNHPRRIMVGGERGMEGKIAEVVAVIRELLANGEAPS